MATDIEKVEDQTKELISDMCLNGGAEANLLEILFDGGLLYDIVEVVSENSTFVPENKV